MGTYRVRRAVAAGALALAAVLGAGGWTAAGTQTAVTGPPPGSAAWRADASLGLHLPDPATASPAEVAAFFRQLSPAQQGELATRHPLVTGNLNGAPVELRYRANTLALTAARAEELSRSADPALTEEDRQAARTRAERYRTLLDGHRQILAFDPRGRGQIAEVYGDLTAAAHSAVIVPGSDIDLLDYDRANDPYGTPAGMAEALYEATGRATAVIAWTGYTTPVGLGPDAATGCLAAASPWTATQKL